MPSSVVDLAAHLVLDGVDILLSLDLMMLASFRDLVALVSESSLEALFSWGGLTVMPFWGMMILAPGWRGTSRLLASPLVSLAPALIYILLVAPGISQVLALVMNPKLGAIAALLGTPRGATLAWMHFLAFDLLVGRQVFFDARGRRMPAWISSPVLFLVLMLGPLGFALHLAARRWFPRAEPASDPSL